MRIFQFIEKYLQLVIFCIIITVGFLFIIHTWEEEEKHQATSILQTARSCASMLSRQELKELQAKPEDSSLIQYPVIKDHLKEIVRVNKNLKFVYIWKLREGKIFFIADSEPNTSKDYSPPGQEYVEAKPEDIKPFIDGKEFITPPLTDRWGTWKSVYVPIKNESDGKVTAVLGMDFDARSWENNVLYHVLESVVLTILILLLFYILLNVYSKNKSLKNLLNEYQLAKMALITNEQKFRNLVEASSDIIWETDINRKYTYLSPQVENILGYKSAELIGKTPFDNMPPEEAQKIRKISDEIIVSKRPFATLINIVLHKNGTEIILETSGIPILAENGSLLGYRGVDRDITERKQNEDIILTTNRKLKLILDVAGEGIVGVNMEGKITFANPKAAELLGYEINDLIGKHSHSLFHHSYPDGTPFPPEKCPNYATLNNGEHVLGEDFYWKKDNTGFHIAFSSAPIYENNKITGLVITFFDISKRKQSESEINAKSEELERFNKLMVNREQKKIELKKEINELLVINGGKERYKNRMD